MDDDSDNEIVNILKTLNKEDDNHYRRIKEYHKKNVK
jgi:rubrerythrin